MTGESGTVAAHGKPYFEYVNDVNPEAGETFNRALAQLGAIMAPLIVDAYDFSSAAGSATWGVGAASSSPRCCGDTRRPTGSCSSWTHSMPVPARRSRRVVSPIAASWSRATSSRRCPTGATSTSCRPSSTTGTTRGVLTILANVRKAMPPGARLLVIENLLDADGREKDKLTRGFDLLMLVLTGAGRERTPAQFETLFGRTGLHLERDITLPPLLHVLEVVPQGPPENAGTPPTRSLNDPSGPDHRDRSENRGAGVPPGSSG